MARKKFQPHTSQRPAEESAAPSPGETPSAEGAQAATPLRNEPAEPAGSRFDGEEAAWGDPESDEPRRKAKGRKGRRPAGCLPLGFLLLFLAVALPAIIGFSWHYYQSGYASGLSAGMNEAKKIASRGETSWPAEVAAELDLAMIELRDDQADAALTRLQKVESANPAVSSLAYLVALAALQSGDIDLAEQKASESIDKQERISDSLALLAVLASQKAGDATRPQMGVPRLRAEQLLRQACLADAANPYPRFELGTLLRYQGRREEAIAEIKGAQARLNPIDSHMIMGITLELMKLETLPVEQLPPAEASSDDVRKVFPAAYAAMRRGDFPQAAALLQKCRESLPADVFGYLIFDPVILKYRDQPELKVFFGS
ncbi:MAG: tetratricopeptide repeat protein [Terrimicrobiaceae bacterium]